MAQKPIALIVGLGNPGDEYRNTRHNVGFDFLDRLAQAKGARFSHQAKFFGETARISTPAGDVWLLRVGALRHSRIVHERVRRVAVCTGAGGSLLGEALRAGAELYLTADLKYNDFMAPSGRLTVADIGHFESEYCAIEILFEIFSKNLRTFVVRKSRCSCNPVNYLCL